MGAGNAGEVTRFYIWAVLVPRDKQEAESTEMDRTRSIRSSFHALSANPKKLPRKLESNKYNHGPRRRFLGSTA